MYTILVVTHVLVSVALIGLVLIQHGKGADAGAAFGSGASGTVFGSRGSANFLTRTTAWLAGVFFVISLALAYIVNGRTSGTGSVVDAVPAVTAPPVAAIPEAATSSAGAAATVSAQPAAATRAEPEVPAAESPKAAPAAGGEAKPKVPE